MSLLQLYIFSELNLFICKCKNHPYSNDILITLAGIVVGSGYALLLAGDGGGGYTPLLTYGEGRWLVSLPLGSDDG